MTDQTLNSEQKQILFLILRYIIDVLDPHATQKYEIQKKLLYQFLKRKLVLPMDIKGILLNNFYSILLQMNGEYLSLVDANGIIITRKRICEKIKPILMHDETNPANFQKIEGFFDQFECKKTNKVNISL